MRLAHNQNRRPNRSDRRLFTGELSVQRQNWKPTPAEAPVAPLALVTPTLNDAMSLWTWKPTAKADSATRTAPARSSIQAPDNSFHHCIKAHWQSDVSGASVVLMAPADNLRCTGADRRCFQIRWRGGGDPPFPVRRPGCWRSPSGSGGLAPVPLRKTCILRWPM